MCHILCPTAHGPRRKLLHSTLARIIPGPARPEAAPEVPARLRAAFLVAEREVGSPSCLLHAHWLSKHTVTILSQCALPVLLAEDPRTAQLLGASAFIFYRLTSFKGPMKNDYYFMG